MTNEMAIRILIGDVLGTTEQTQEAVTMAVRALSQPDATYTNDGDTISRQAAIEIIQNMYPGMPRVPWMRKDWQKRYEPYIRTENAIRELPSARLKGKWIPIKTRPMTAEERTYFEEHFGPLYDGEDVMYDCPMPEDGQRILISTRWGVDVDTCEADDGYMGLDERGDWEGVLAWMPAPDLYKEVE